MVNSLDKSLYLQLMVDSLDEGKVAENKLSMLNDDTLTYDIDIKIDS